MLFIRGLFNNSVSRHVYRRIVWWLECNTLACISKTAGVALFRTVSKIFLENLRKTTKIAQDKRARLPRVMKRYSQSGRRNHGRPLKRLLDTLDRNGSTSGPTPWQIWWWWWQESYQTRSLTEEAYGENVLVHSITFSKVMCTLVRALRLCTGSTAHRGVEV
jgi:hypothetical protein